MSGLHTRSRRCDTSDQNVIAEPVDLAQMNEIEVLARTLYGEARGEPVAGKEAVASVVMNRVRRSQEKSSGYWWGNDVITVCTKPWQFSCWNVDDPNRPKLLTVEAKDRNYQSCIRIARRAVRGAGSEFYGHPASQCSHQKDQRFSGVGGYC